MSSSPWVAPSQRTGKNNRPWLERLRVQAEATAAVFGHELEPWSSDGSRASVAFCSNCKLAAVITAHARGDDEEFGGSVLKVDCMGMDTIPTWAPAR